MKQGFEVVPESTQLDAGPKPTPSTVQHSVGEWRDMASAPRDGTSILCFNPMIGTYSTAFTTRWTGEPGEHKAGTYEGFPCGFWPNGVDSFPFGQWDCAPYCWQPMPVPPTDAQCAAFLKERHHV